MCIAARRSGRDWCSASIAAAHATALPSRSRAPNREATLAYLRAREQVTSVYREVFTPIRLMTPEAETVEAVTYVVDRAHQQYAGALPVEAQLAYVRQGKGQSGDCTDYVMSTLAHLREMDIHDHLARKPWQRN